MTDRRLYLFDIDSTLITTGGAGGTAMRAAFTALWGDDDPFVGVEFYGRTDRSILKQALAKLHTESGPFEESLRRFKRAYFRRLPLTLQAKAGQVLPGVTSLLSLLATDERASIALGTGNFRVSAGMKLRHYGIDQHFGLGGFGDRAEERADIIAGAILAANRKFGRHDSVYVIGDTVHDMTSAKANGAIAVGVTTGVTREGELSQAGADIVLPTLEDASDLLRPGLGVH